MRVMAIPDFHAPYQHRGALSFVRRCRDRWHPNRVICLGDEADQHQVSRWAKDPESKGHADEMRAVRAFFRLLAADFPSLEIVDSNHAQRPAKRALEAGLAPEWLRSFHEVFGVPSTWRWAERIKVDSVTYLHGDGFSGAGAAEKAARTLRGSAVIGHVHSHAGIHWLNGPAGPIFGMCAGCLIDRRAAAFRYARASLNWPLLGCGFVEDGVPRWEPFREGMK